MANPNQPDQEKELPVDSEKQRREAECMHDILLLLEHLAQNEKVTIELIIDRLYDVGATNLIEHKIHSQRWQKTVKPIAKLSRSAFRIVAWYWFRQNCPKLITDWLHSKITFEPEISEAGEISNEANSGTVPEPDKSKEQVLANGDKAASNDLNNLSPDGKRSPVELEQPEQMATTQSGSTIETRAVGSANGNTNNVNNWDNGDRHEQNGQVANRSASSVGAIVLAPSSNDQNHDDSAPSKPEIEKLRQQVRLLTTALVGVIIVFSGGAIWLGDRLDLNPNQIFSGQTQTTLIEKQQVTQ